MTIGKEYDIVDIEVFKNRDWVLKLSMIYENILANEKSENLTSKYSTVDTDSMKENFKDLK